MTKHSVYKDYFNRRNLKKNYFKILLLKSFLNNKKISKSIRFKIMLRLQKSFKPFLGNKLVNRCINSKKVRSVSRLSNLTKSSFREHLRFAQLSGFKKASW